MSAPSPMGRTAILIVLLAAGLTAFASDAPTHTANPHRKAATARLGHQDARKRRTAHPRTAGERRSQVAEGSPRRPVAHSSHSTSHRTRSAAARDTHTAHQRIAAERVSYPHRSGVTAEELRRARDLMAERDRQKERTAERGAMTAEGAKSALSDAHRRAATRSKIAAEPDPDAASFADPAEGPEPREDDPHVMTERTSLAITRGGMPAPLRGSLALLERQDQRLEADGLERILDESDLSGRIAHHLLVPLPVSDALTVNAQLPMHHRYCRPWTARFLADLARAHEAVFRRPLEVSSAVRTVEYQEHLVRINGNAAPAQGDVFSPHLMGATIDISKKQMSPSEIAWMRRRLLALELAGKIDVEEEFEQACFHITVYKSYAPPRAARPPKSRAGTSRGQGSPAHADIPVADSTGQ